MAPSSLANPNNIAVVAAAANRGCWSFQDEFIKDGGKEEEEDVEK